MRRRVLLIKAVHTAIFWFMIGCFVYNLWAAATATFNWVLLITFGSHVVEGVVLLFNHWTCPLRTLAEKCGAENGAVSDIFLSKWLASRLFQLGVGLFVIEVVWLGISFMNR